MNETRKSHRRIFADVSKNSDGSKITWTHRRGDKYLWLGYDANGQKFRSISTNFLMADAINVFEGRLYLVREGRRKLIKTATDAFAGARS